MKRFKEVKQGYCQAGIYCKGGVMVQISPLTEINGMSLCKSCYKEVQRVYKTLSEMPDYQGGYDHFE